MVHARPVQVRVYSALVFAFLAGAGIGVLSMALVGTSDVLSAGIFLGGLGAMLGTIGTGAVLSVMLGTKREFDFHAKITQMLVVVLGGVLGGVMTLLVALLSAATEHSVTAWMAQALPSENYAIGLWTVWGMVGGLVWSGLYRREMLREA